MSQLAFNSSESATLGVEIELGLVDANDYSLVSICPAVLESLPAIDAGAIKPELMQCYVEVNTGVCKTVGEAADQIQNNMKVLEDAVEKQNGRLMWSATHPFSSWRDQDVTPDERYQSLVNLLQDTARQLVTFGLHVHVGVDSGDKAINLCDRLMRHLPVLLAASCNGPFWEGRNTGLSSWRTKVMEGLPTAGLPPFMRNWSEYSWLINHLIHTGFIESIREIWWDVRPHHNFGTVEVRICDMPGDFRDVVGLVALVHCLVTSLSNEIDEGTYQHDCHPMLVRQNKWRAARYGLDASLVDNTTHELVPARETIRRLVALLEPTARDLGCQAELQEMIRIADSPTWAQQQWNRFQETDSMKEVAALMVR
ncbi:MAG: YbdK family carboxylate-amine ligase [Pirellulaceae bacterium]|nr:YbdK family carboxylate-amine ligase [Pirellulaceae bacterium]